MNTDRIVSAPNIDNIPTSALNFVATFDNPWYIKNQTITLTDNEYAQYVRTDVGPYPVGQECFIIPTQDAPNNLTATVVNDTTSESLSLEEQEDTDTGKMTWMFVMPDAPVTITIGVSQEPTPTTYSVSIVKNDPSEPDVAETDVQQAVEGDTVTITPLTGYTIGSTPTVITNDTEQQVSVTEVTPGQEYTFEMPAENVSVMVTGTANQ